MERRHFLRYLGIGAASASISACGQESSTAAASCEETKQAPLEWKMVTTWPKNFPVLGTGAEYFAQLINELSNGRLTVKVYGAGEIVPAFESFDAVSDGTVEMAHGSAYYWKGKNPAFQFFSTVPFGMSANEMNAWLYFGGGLELWQRAYEPFGLEPMPAGNTGVQMGGWFNKEINSLDDLRGLKMRIPGLGGEVLRKAGGTPVNVPGGDLFMSLKTGVIDATEWVGPYNDLAFGLNDAAKYYYSPGWHEPGTAMECIINKEAMAKLPADLQSIVRNAARITNSYIMLEYIAENKNALEELVKKQGVEIRSFPNDVIEKLRKLSAEVVSELAEQDEFSREIYDSYSKFANKSKAWYKLSEQAYLNIR